jgi:hypothetical protein
LLKLLNVFIACSLLVAIGGCGPSVPYKTTKVSGKVTYDDGTPIPGHRVVVQFLPQVQAINPKQYPRPGRAEVKPDGTFSEVTTWKYADGVIPGRQKVLVESLDERQRPNGAVDPQFATAETTLTADVVAGAGPLEIKVPKPARAKKAGS